MSRTARYTTRMVQVLERVRTSDVQLDNIEDEALDALWDLDHKLRTRAITMETYRNDKGNWWTEIVRELIQQATGIEVKPASIVGASETHNVDLALLRGSTPYLCVEVKAQGNPGYTLGRELRPERRIQSDIDKRLKEVKYTSMDLKRKYDMGGAERIFSLDREEDWIEWKENSLPKFYAVWLGRKASSESQQPLIVKLREANKYLNGIGALIYENRDDGKGYRQVDLFRDEFPVSGVINRITYDVKTSSSCQAQC